MRNSSYKSSRTEERFQQLRVYYQDAAIDPNTEFRCLPKGPCRELEVLPSGYQAHKGGLAHVGEQYDVKFDGGELRLMFVGFDGGNHRFGIDDRRRDIQAYPKRRNQHYDGIVKVLIEVFQEPFDGEESEWRSLLKKMTQTNATRCAISKSGAMNTHTTVQMRRCCWIHFRKEIEILQPTVMFFHGKELQSWFLKQVGEDGQTSRLDSGSDLLDVHAREIVWTSLRPNFKTLLLFFSHPSRHHFGKQWDSAVVPVLKELREMRKLPVFQDQWRARGRRDWPAI